MLANYREFEVTSSGAVDTSVIGTYEITYSTADSSGNTTVEMKYVNVIE